MTVHPFGVAVLFAVLAEIVAGIVLLAFAITKVRRVHTRAAGLLASAAAIHLLAVTLGCLFVTRPFGDGQTALTLLDALAITHPVMRALSLALVAAATLVWAGDRR